MNSFTLFYCDHKGESTLSQMGIHPFRGFSVGNREELLHFSYSWVALDVISTPYSLPTLSLQSPQGAVNPIPSCHL